MKERRSLRVLKRSMGWTRRCCSPAVRTARTTRRRLRPPMIRPPQWRRPQHPGRRYRRPPSQMPLRRRPPHQRRRALRPAPSPSRGRSPAATVRRTPPTSISASAGYTESEFFVEGIATAFEPVGDLTEDGRWTVTEGNEAPYRTRIIVRAPEAAAFSGVVIVEWLNATRGSTATPTGDTPVRRSCGPDRRGSASPHSRSAWSAVTPSSGSRAGAASVGTDPERYGSLEHPGDAYSYDIFTQAATALLTPDGPSPLGDLVPTHLVAAGEWMPAFFMTRPTPTRSSRSPGCSAASSSTAVAGVPRRSTARASSVARRRRRPPRSVTTPSYR